MPRVLIIPGAAVQAYVLPALHAVRARGIDVCLLAAPGHPGGPADLRRYGLDLARRCSRQEPVDLLVGLSVGAQAAAVAAAAAPAAAVRHLVLVSPTVDPSARSSARLLARWLAGGRREAPRLLLEQAPDWRRAGVREVRAVVRSALSVPVEQVLPDVRARLTVVHGEADAITSHSYAAELAAEHGGELVVVPAALHSWPYGDAARFADTVAGLLS